MTLNALAAYSQAYGDPRVNFWRSPMTWPNDTNDYVFAARAILTLGPHLLGADWSAAAPEKELRWELPSTLSLYMAIEDIQRGVTLLERYSTKYSERRPGGTLLTSKPDVFPTDDEWAEAVSLAKQETEESWRNYLPFLQVSVMLATACRDGTVQMATRPIEGGPFAAKDWHFWNGESVHRRFGTCRVDEAKPFAAQTVKEGGSWLFIERTSLETFIKGPSPSANAEPERFEAIEKAARPRRRPGRPRVHSWETMAIEYSRLATTKAFNEETSTSAIADKLLDWAADRWENLPEKSTVEDKVSVWRQMTNRADN